MCTNQQVPWSSGSTERNPHFPAHFGVWSKKGRGFDSGRHRPISIGSPLSGAFRSLVKERPGAHSGRHRLQKNLPPRESRLEKTSSRFYSLEPQSHRALGFGGNLCCFEILDRAEGVEFSIHMGRNIVTMGRDSNQELLQERCVTVFEFKKSDTPATNEETLYRWVEHKTVYPFVVRRYKRF